LRWRRVSKCSTRSPRLQAVQNLSFFTRAIGRQQLDDRLTDHLRGRITKDSLCSLIPAHDRAVRSLLTIASSDESTIASYKRSAGIKVDFELMGLIV
jgi:hypothetical protein